MQPEETPKVRDFMTAGEPDAGTVAYAGRPLPAGREIAPERGGDRRLANRLRPRNPLNIYDLGLIYRLDIAADGSVAIDMTLTAPGCPVAGAMPGAVADAVAGVTASAKWKSGWSGSRRGRETA